jgi:hypothetical protein
MIIERKRSGAGSDKDAGAGKIVATQKGGTLWYHVKGCLKNVEIFLDLVQ